MANTISDQRGRNVLDEMDEYLREQNALKLFYIHQAKPKRDLRPNWIMKEDEIIAYGESMLMHPFTLAQFVARTFDTNKGLDILQKYLHESIDHKFNR